MPEGNERPGPPRSPSGVEVMSPDDCVKFLGGTTTVGRLAFRSSAGQQLLPVNFVFRHERVYFTTSTDSILAELAEGCDDVAFEIDYPDRLMQHGWSVLVKGTTQKASGLGARGAQPLGRTDAERDHRSPNPKSAVICRRLIQV
jgi:nitroimidazol reductase NimA-like FMN-containing flavoprotein (pyridoxamine 5'-phosphate oxidase superfamily)